MDGTYTPIIPSLDWYAVLASHQHRTSTPLGEAAPIAVGQSNGKIWGEAIAGNENNLGREMHAC